MAYKIEHGNSGSFCIAKDDKWSTIVAYGVRNKIGGGYTIRCDDHFAQLDQMPIKNQANKIMDILEDARPKHKFKGHF
jgi:hypothetical protein